MKDYIQSALPWGPKLLTPHMTYAAGGCGPTSVADCVSNAGRNGDITPEDVGNYMNTFGGVIDEAGTLWEAIKRACDHFGCNAIQINGDSVYGHIGTAAEQEWLRQMKTGKYVGILLMGCGFFANAGHYIAIESVDSKNNVVTYDVAFGLRSGIFNWNAIVPAGQPGAVHVGCPFFAGRVKIFYLVEKHPAKADDIAVDGMWGVKTTKKAQKVFGCSVIDGIVSNQNKLMVGHLANCQPASWEFVKQAKLKNGSALIKAIQKKLKITADGFCGIQTIVALQQFLGVDADGIFGPDSVKAFQRWLNRQ